MDRCKLDVMAEDVENSILVELSQTNWENIEFELSNYC